MMRRKIVIYHDYQNHVHISNHYHSHSYCYARQTFIYFCKVG